MMKTILFLHGFYASGSCNLAETLKKSFEGKVRVLTPDLPLHPKESLEFIHSICDKESVDLLVGNSCGSFLAQLLAPIVGIPALLGNPHFGMHHFLESRMGENSYKSPRMDGHQNFVIDDVLIAAFKELEEVQFNYCSNYYKDKVWGMFGENDTLAHYKDTFQQQYHNVFTFPGGHTPTEDEVRTWYVPAIEKMLFTYQKPEQRIFCHFKGGHYRFVRTAFDSESKERMVIYQALYGDMDYWVRPEKMFFEKITRDGKTFSRFLEVDE